MAPAPTPSASAPAALTGADLHAILRAVAADMQAHVDELRELDANLGDGDLGITFRLASAALADAPGPTTGDIGLFVADLGLSINRASPSTFGTLLASAFVWAARAIRGKSALSAADLAAMGASAVEGIKKTGKAEVGDKTMLDTLAPAVDAFAGELAKSGDAASALRAAAQAGAEGMNATAGMTAKFGRASWRAEQSAGPLDAGAVAMYYLVESFARHAGGFV
jgi:dihydroxyacetone kinase-like protein